LQKSAHQARDAKYLSFAFALTAQRFPAHPMANAYYLMSFIYGKENLVGLERLLAECAKFSNLDRMLSLLSARETFASVQEGILLSKFGARPRGDMQVIEASAKLLSWLN
jgi:hypothetical protein